METITISQFRQHTGSYIARAEHGEIIRITRRGKAVAQLEPCQKITAGRKGFPSLSKFRAKMKVRGKPVSQTVVDMRNEEG